MSLPHPPSASDPAAARRLRAALDDAGFTEEAVETRLPAQYGLPPVALGVPHDIALEQADDPLGVLVRLLVRGTAVDVSLLDRAVVEDLVSLGLAVVEGGAVRAPIKVFPSEGLLLAADRIGADASSDVVLGANPSSSVAARVAPRRPVGRALDIGTGGGLLAMLAAAHSQHVVGADINERALEFAAFNAGLNDVAGIEWRAGSWTEPVEGEQFDFVISNPPYVVSPDNSFTYRDGGLEGDGVTRHVLAEGARVLAPGGVLAMTGTWIVRSGQEWDEPMRAAIEATGCEGVVLRFEKATPAEYAAGWTTNSLADGLGPYEEAARRWAAYYSALDVDSLAFGALVLRRSGSMRVRAVDAPGGVTAPCGDHVQRLLDAPDLEEVDDAEVLAGRYRLVPELRIDQTLTQREGRWRSHPASLRINPGLGVKALIEAKALRALYLCDGTRTLAEAAASAGVEDVTAATAMRALVHTGLAEPAEGAYRPGHG